MIKMLRTDTLRIDMLARGSYAQVGAVNSAAFLNRVPQVRILPGPPILTVVEPGRVDL